MAGERATAGRFGAPGEAAQAIRALRAAGFGDVRALMPAPYPEVVAALGRRRSRLGAASLSGAAAGLAAGAALTVGTSLDWPITVGGKPVVSVPPFVVICFELTILAGALATVTALLVAGFRGRARAASALAGPPEGGVVVIVAGGDRALAARTLSGNGAHEVHDA
jgi:hypothetical protein